MSVNRCDLLVAGGAGDPNLRRLLELKPPDAVVVPLLQTDESEPRFSWRFASDVLEVEGSELIPKALFIRHDVFAYLKDGSPDRLERGGGWYAAVYGWALAHPDVRMLNRNVDPRAASKPVVCHLARQLGLRIPAMVVTNDEEVVRAFNSLQGVVKPVIGGTYCQSANDVLGHTDWINGRAPMPALVQERLSYPEGRIYFVGKRSFTFEIEAATLDSRLDPAPRIDFVRDGSVRWPVKELDELRTRLRLDFCAFDLKCNDDGQSHLLEVNVAPMFEAFDRVADGVLGSAILAELGVVGD